MFGNSKKVNVSIEDQLGVSTDTLTYFERQKQLEIDHGELKARYAELEDARENDRQHYHALLSDRDRHIAFLKQQLLEAEKKRDRYQTRAIDAEAIVREVSQMLLASAERRAAAEAMEERAPPRPGDDVDQLSEELAEAVRTMPKVITARRDNREAEA